MRRKRVAQKGCSCEALRLEASDDRAIIGELGGRGARAEAVVKEEDCEALSGSGSSTDELTEACAGISV